MMMSEHIILDIIL